MNNLISIGKSIVRAHAPQMFDQNIDLITVSEPTRNSDGDLSTTQTITVEWSGLGSLQPNLPRFERNAFGQVTGGVEERRAVYFCYVPHDAPADTSGVKVRYNSRVYELVKEALPIGGYTGASDDPALWRLDLGAPLD